MAQIQIKKDNKINQKFDSCLRKQINDWCDQTLQFKQEENDLKQDQKEDSLMITEFVQQNYSFDKNQQFQNEKIKLFEFFQSFYYISSQFNQQNDSKIQSLQTLVGKLETKLNDAELQQKLQSEKQIQYEQKNSYIQNLLNEQQSEIQELKERLGNITKFDLKEIWDKLEKHNKNMQILDIKIKNQSQIQVRDRNDIQNKIEELQLELQEQFESIKKNIQENKIYHQNNLDINVVQLQKLIKENQNSIENHLPQINALQTNLNKWVKTFQQQNSACLNKIQFIIDQNLLDISNEIQDQQRMQQIALQDLLDKSILNRNNCDYDNKLNKKKRKIQSESKEQINENYKSNISGISDKILYNQSKTSPLHKLDFELQKLNLTTTNLQNGLKPKQLRFKRTYTFQEADKQEKKNQNKHIKDIYGMNEKVPRKNAPNYQQYEIQLKELKNFQEQQFLPTQKNINNSLEQIKKSEQLLFGDYQKKYDNLNYSRKYIKDVNYSTPNKVKNNNKINSGSDKKQSSTKQKNQCHFSQNNINTNHLNQRIINEQKNPQNGKAIKQILKQNAFNDIDLNKKIASINQQEINQNQDKHLQTQQIQYNNLLSEYGLKIDTQRK
ncbi:hypothetical protein PPERSA_02135 [Pseudocohnilembus persalinus]|uniref:Uncharacterized protein n=1 Tax=Pseudocohnilembus persalinus TaxID=266149 RepID=A0A0V0Q7F5_PSEPJ|nr:hypothetical protein PPERSA_02135 [Pseudocohnilembus persalinus]|eukprot:KRW98157.1 hypothetical protein PPERSA_02135 [Pseudocohnilembus persalinus]